MIMKKIVKPHKARKPSASTDVPSFARGKDQILKSPARLQRRKKNELDEFDDGKDKTWYDELNNSMLGAGIKFVDPTGISSYYDVYQSAQNMYNNPSWSNAGSLALETFGALPLIGKLGKALKIGKKIIKRGGEPELEKMGQWIIDQGYPRMIGITKDGADAQEYDKGKDSGIHIKKANRGKFTAAAKRAGMGVQAYARKILKAPKGKYSSTLRKRANFAANAAKWHK